MTALASTNALTFGPGSVLEGKYRLERLIGEGAMGRVWLARNLSLDLPLAIKIVQADLHGPAAIERLVTEARAIAQLRHPNIVRVFDCQTNGRFAYAVMELLEGCTLADLMDEGPLPAQLAVRLCLPLLDGLACVHRTGIVHRDIKPENVFIARAGDRICPKLIDFGIARHDALEPRRAAPSRGGSKRLIIGSPGYMAPEQAWGEEDIDVSADVWAVAVVLYEAISGECAFPAQTYRTFLKSLAERELTPLRTPGSAGIWPIIAPALVTQRAQRSASCVEMRHALAEWLRKQGLSEDLSADTLPPLWASPGGPLDRALRRTQHVSRTSDPRAVARTTLQGYASPVSRSGRRPGPSTIRTIPTSVRDERRVRPWSVFMLAAGALIGVFVGHGRLSGGPDIHAGPRPAMAASLAPLTAAGPAQADVAEPEPERAPIETGVAPPRAQRTPRGVRAPRQQHSDAQRVQLRREAAALGLKSPW